MLSKRTQLACSWDTHLGKLPKSLWPGAFLIGISGIGSHRGAISMAIELKSQKSLPSQTGSTHVLHPRGFCRFPSLLGAEIAGDAPWLPSSNTRAARGAPWQQLSRHRGGLEGSRCVICKEYVDAPTDRQRYRHQ